jgi:hypothetical protein
MFDFILDQIESVKVLPPHAYTYEWHNGGVELKIRGKPGSVGRPNGVEFVYERRGNAYFAECQGVVSFYAHNPNNENGYGGSSFTLNLTDGTTVRLRGPWSSGPTWMAAQGFPHSVEITWDNVVHYVTLELAQKIVDRFGLPAKLAKLEKYGETSYHFARRQ